MKAKNNSNRINEIEKYLCAQGKNYLDKRSEDLVEIKHSLEDVRDETNLEKIKKIGHKIKGSAGLYGFSKLSEIGFDLELSVQNGNLKHLPEVVNEFQSFLNEAKTNQ